MRSATSETPPAVLVLVASPVSVSSPGAALPPTAAAEDAAGRVGLTEVGPREMPLKTLPHALAFFHSFWRTPFNENSVQNLATRAHSYCHTVSSLLL